MGGGPLCSAVGPASPDLPPVRVGGPTSPNLPAVRAGGRRPAREIATRELRSEWSISRPALALPPSTGTATRPPHPAITHAIPAPTPNFACNSPATISNLEFTALELQRFQTLLKLHPIKLHATFRRASPGTTAHGHRDQASHPATTHVIPAPTPNSACNSPTTISNLEFTTLELQRFQTLLKLHRIELHATFRRAGPAATHGHRSQALGNLAVIGTGIPRGYPQALFLSDSYPQGSDSAWITRCHARSVDVDGPTRGPTKE